MIDPGVCFDKLAGFQTADEIADYFKGEGIQGQMQIETRCPIATYFYRHTDSLFVSVGTIIELHTAHPSYDHAQSQWLAECTEAMNDFIQVFDEGEYPELISCIEDESCGCPSCRRSEFYQ